jgi:hypothetical protein
MMALNVVLSTSMNLSGRHIWAEEQHAFCSFNGFMNQMFVIQSGSPLPLLCIFYTLLLSGHMAD